jgi:hypothetical protein
MLQLTPASSLTVMTILTFLQNVVDFSSQDVKDMGSELLRAAVASYSKLDSQLLLAMQVGMARSQKLSRHKHADDKALPDSPGSM